MKPTLPLIILLISSSLLPACIGIRQQFLHPQALEWHYPGKKIDASGEVVSAQLNFTGYCHIVLEGSFDIESVAGTTENTPIRLVGDKAFVSRIQGQMSQGTLTLRYDPQFDYVVNKPVRVLLPVKHLKTLKAKGNGNLILNQLKAPCLSVNIEGNMNAWIKGNLQLAYLRFASHGKLVMYWINSTCTRIDAARQSTLLLAGIANNLEINAEDNAYVDAKFLRSQSAHVHTKGCSRVDVSVSRYFNGIADDNSNIYYFHNRPDFIASYMHGSGSILDMHDDYPPYPDLLR